MNFKNEYLYLIGGGTVISEVSQDVERYTIKLGKWSSAPKLNKGRRAHSSCSLDDKIYTFGGWNYSGIVQSIEILNGNYEIE